MTVSVLGSHLQVVQMRKFKAHTLLALQVHCCLAAPLPVWAQLRSLFKNWVGDTPWQTFHFQLCSSLEVGLWVGPPPIGLRRSVAPDYRNHTHMRPCGGRFISFWHSSLQTALKISHLLLVPVSGSVFGGHHLFSIVCVSMFVYVHSIPYMLKVLCLSASLPIFMCICVPVLLVLLGA